MELKPKSLLFVVTTQLIAVALLWCARPSSAAPRLDFDQGIDVSVLLKGLKRTAAQEPMKPAAFGPITRWTRDCREIGFGPGDALMSKPVDLRSRIYRQECVRIPHGGDICRDVLDRTEHRRVRIKVTGREALPSGKSEKFRVCLDGFWLNAKVVKSPFAYELKLPSSFPELPGQVETIEARKKDK